jgi:DNA adenine methylase
MKPFLKWAGGKRWLTHRMKVPDFTFERYIEPFVGSGAIYFHLMPQHALLSDSNKHLMETYAALQADTSTVEKLLEKHAKLHSEQYYYQVRSKIFKTSAQRAARFIYLNRTCWNGLYRENKFGQFNVPKGTKSAVLLPDDDFKATAAVLQGVQFLIGDFEFVIDLAGCKDFLFVDPPYTVKHNRNGFLKYNERIFSWEDQIRLGECVRRAALRGARVLMTNAFHESVLSLYADFAEILPLSRYSTLSGRKQYRAPTQEALIMINIKSNQILKSENEFLLGQHLLSPANPIWAIERSA